MRMRPNSWSACCVRPKPKLDELRKATDLDPNWRKEHHYDEAKIRVVRLIVMGPIDISHDLK